MQFSPDEYLLLSRSGRVPLSHSRPVRSPSTSSGRTVRRRRVRAALAGRVHAVQALRGGVRATWTAFGPGSAEL